MYLLTRRCRGTDRLHVTGDPPPAHRPNPGLHARSQPRLVLVALAASTPIPGPGLPLPAAWLCPHQTAVAVLTIFGREAALLDLVFDWRPGPVGVPAVEVLRQRTRLGSICSGRARPGHCAAFGRTSRITRPVPSAALTPPQTARVEARSSAIRPRPGPARRHTPARADRPHLNTTASHPRQPQAEP
jgi:hypothetical protein